MTEKILENKKHGMRALIIIIALYAAGIAAMIIGGIGMANAVDYVSTPFGVGAVNSVAKPTTLCCSSSAASGSASAGCRSSA